MNRVIDNSLVGLALLLSAGYAVSSLGPKGMRRRLLALLRGALARAAASMGQRRAVRWLAIAAADEEPGACGGCGGCRSQASPPPTAGLAPTDDVSVPVAKICRRT